MCSCKGEKLAQWPYVGIELSTKTHSSKEMTEFCFENADVRSKCYQKQGMKSQLSLSLECVKTKLCKPCTSFTSNLHSLCGMVWCRILRVKDHWNIVCMSVCVCGGGGGIKTNLQLK